MSQMNTNPVHPSPPSNGPWKWARLVGRKVAVLVLILFAVVGGFAALVAAYIAVRAVVWAAARVLDALGV